MSISWWIIPLLVVLAGGGLFVILVLPFAGLWIRAKASGTGIGIINMLMMRLRRVKPHTVVENAINLQKAGLLDVELDEMEAHVLAGGCLNAVTEAVISAAKAGLETDFRKLAAMDLAGRDVVDAVEHHVDPKVFLCPSGESQKTTIDGVAQDGVRVAARARITVRTRLDRLVGGAGKETLLARVGEGIVAAIGRAETHQRIIENADMISEYLLEHSLDSGTCFEIVSVDVDDIDVKDNVGAELRSAQAQTDKRVAQAKAEMRRAAAIARRQEMTARTTGMRSRVMGAESVIPRATAAAVNEKNIGKRSPLAENMPDRMRWKLPT